MRIRRHKPVPHVEDLLYLRLEDRERPAERRDVIMISPEDIRRLGLTPDQRVTVRGPAGTLGGQVVRPYDIRPGNAAMYYPEANVLVPRSADSSSRTPAFKNVLVTVAAVMPAVTTPAAR